MTTVLIFERIPPLLTTVFRLALDLAEQSGITLPTATAANGQYERAMAAGLGDEDFSAVFKTASNSK